MNIVVCNVCIAAVFCDCLSADGCHVKADAVNAVLFAVHFGEVLRGGFDDDCRRIDGNRNRLDEHCVFECGFTVVEFCSAYAQNALPCVENRAVCDVHGPLNRGIFAAGSALQFKFFGIENEGVFAPNESVNKLEVYAVFDFDDDCVLFCNVHDIFRSACVELDNDVAVVERAAEHDCVLIHRRIIFFGKLCDFCAERKFCTVCKQRFDLACDNHILCRNLVCRSDFAYFAFNRRSEREHA